MNKAPYSKNVFINCPFDDAYLEILRPILFTVIRFGFNPRIASERFDSLENRIDKIKKLIQMSKYSIHDLSRLKAAKRGDYSRMNMPFELGIDYGCRLFGSRRLKQKKCLILEAERYEFMKSLSDLSGVDIKNHNNKPFNVVRAIRNWFVETIGLRNVESPTAIWDQYLIFQDVFCRDRLSNGFTISDLNAMPVQEYMYDVRVWMGDNKQ